LDALILVIPNIIDGIIDAIPQIVDAIVRALPQILAAAFTLFTAIVSAIIKATPNIIDAIIKLIPKMVTALLDNVPKLVNAGFQLIKGLVKGMMDNIPRLLGDVVGAIGRTLTNGVNAVFQIKSPSRVFYGIGENVVQGLQDGIMDGKRLLESASFGMANTVEVSAMNSLGSMDTMALAPSRQGSAGTSQSVFNVNVNAGMGADGQDIGRKIVDEIIRFERSSGRVFARA
jgi:phage-related protein